MYLFVLSLIVVGAALVALAYFQKHPHHDNPLVLPTRVAEPNLGQRLQETVKENDPVKVKVTYNDGTTETFTNEDGEIDVTDSGLITIRPSEDRCITISPYAFRKIEEVHE